MQKLSYRDSGVNIDEGNALVCGIKPLAKSTFDAQVLGGIGGFAGAYALPSGFKNPALVSSTDGVGTKLKLAIEAQKLDTIGIDLVAMCVNDLICAFATPLFFLDYYATAKLDKNAALAVISGIVEGCKLAKCALLGGETAEMPGLYAAGDFDLAGFAVGIAEREDLEGSKIECGDILVALPSSGIHSNGYSLVRKLLFERLKMRFDAPFAGRTLIEALLEPTRIYVPTFLKLRAHLRGLAHITGGGIVENLPRIFPPNLGANIQKSAIRTPEIFTLFAPYVEEAELWRTFNMGVGMVAVVAKDSANAVLENCDGFVIGEVVRGEGVAFV